LAPDCFFRIDHRSSAVYAPFIRAPPTQVGDTSMSTSSEPAFTETVRLQGAPDTSIW
jgi:hypothetical protein